MINITVKSGTLNVPQSEYALTILRVMNRYYHPRDHYVL
jgi:hypothetical protein